MPFDFVAIVDWLKARPFSERIELAKIAAGTIAFAFGLWQYRKAQKWKRLEFVAGEMKIFFDDPATRLAMTMLDWRKKAIPLFKHRDANSIEQVTVDYSLVAEALGTDPELKYDRYKSAIREIFERYLEFLARFEGFIAAGLVKRKDFTPYLDYWVKLISGNDPHSPEATEKLLPSLWRFIDYFGYRDVRRFVGRYHKVIFGDLKK